MVGRLGMATPNLTFALCFRRALREDFRRVYKPVWRVAQAKERPPMQLSRAPGRDLETGGAAAPPPLPSPALLVMRDAGGGASE